MIRKSIILLLFSVLLPGGLVQADNRLILAVHPFLSHDMVITKFTPLANYLSKATGLNIEVRVGPDYDEHIRFIGNDKVDIAYMGPASYVGMTRQFGAKPLLAKQSVNGHSYFQGNIITRKDSEIKTLSDLKGKRIAFGDPSSTMSYVVPHHMLHQAGVFTSSSHKHQFHQFLYSHDNVALAVLSGDFDAGAVKPAVFKKYESRGLMTIAQTPKISEHLFVARSDLPAEQIGLLRDAMLNIGKSKQGMAALHAIKKTITGLVEVQSSDYDNLRKIMNDSETMP